MKMKAMIVCDKLMKGKGSKKVVLRKRKDRKERKKNRGVKTFS